MARLRMLPLSSNAILLLVAVLLVDINQAFIVPTCFQTSPVHSALRPWTRRTLPFSNPLQSPQFSRNSQRKVSTEVDGVDQTQVQSVPPGNQPVYVNIPDSLRTKGSGIPSRKEKIQVLENQMYESN